VVGDQPVAQLLGGLGVIVGSSGLPPRAEVGGVLVVDGAGETVGEVGVLDAVGVGVGEKLGVLEVVGGGEVDVGTGALLGAIGVGDGPVSAAGVASGAVRANSRIEPGLSSDPVCSPGCGPPRPVLSVAM
jgi:hypothetical protein